MLRAVWVLVTFIDMRIVTTVTNYSQMPNLKVNLEVSLRKDLRWKYSLYPSYKKTVRLYSKTGYYLMIDDEGRISGTLNGHSKHALLEAESYGVNYKRLRKPNSWYVAIDKRGTVRSRKSPRKDTLFRVIYNTEGWTWYQNDATNFVLAFRRNGKLKNKFQDLNLNKSKSKFLMMPKYLTCVET